MAGKRAWPFLSVAIFSTAACSTQPPNETLAVQCITGMAQWRPIVLNLANPQIDGNPATVTNAEIRWETIHTNSFGGALHTRYVINRSDGTVTVENTYVNSNGSRGAQPNQYTGHCFVRPSPF